jgi:transcriptional regulator with XRE-family HTH domain
MFMIGFGRRGITAMPDKKLPLRERRRLVRAFRKQTHLTLVELAELVGLSHAMLSQFENGKVNLSEASWVRLYEAMGEFLRTAKENYQAEIAKAEETAAKLGVSGLLRAQTEPELDDILSRMSPEEAETAIPLLERLSAELDKNSVAWRIARVALGELRLKVKEYKTERLRNLYALQEHFRKESEERKRQLEALERLPGALDDPIVVGLIESLRRELEEKSRELEAMKPLASLPPQEQK